ncbi:MAG: head maturation protease, ClpP-related [Mangrovibacterium sp.]
MKAIVNINGLIGTWNDEKGVELIDIVSQIRAQSGYNEVEVRIGNSEGGIVQTGFDIFNYLKSLKIPVTTIIESYCASITSVIFLAGDKRLMRPGARLMIHNPWGQPVGDADTLDRYSKELRSIEKQLSDLYNQKTNIGKDALTALMRNETEMTADEAVNVGFATGMVEQLKIAAYLKLDNMSKKKTLKEQLKDVLSKLSGDEPVNLTLQDGTGKEIVFDTENDNPSVGDKATVDGSPAEGEFTMPDGRIFVFAAGELKEIKEAAGGGDEEMAATIRKIVKEEVGNAVKAALKETNENSEMATEAIVNLTEKYETLAKSVKSNFKITPKPGDEKKLGGKGKDDVYSKYQPKKKED